jgi:HD-like signal output (HDOD) protein
MDPVLTAKILRLINSAYYNLPQKVTTLVRAIIMLGINTVKNLILSTAILSNLKRKNSNNALDMAGFWRHSLSVGVLSRLIAKKRNIGQQSIEEYFIAGLLHDIGKIPINNRIPEDYQRAIHASNELRQPLFVAEKDVLKIDHTDMGKLITHKWKLGGGIRDTIIFHHSHDAYKGEFEDILLTVALANYQANILKFGSSGNRYPEIIGLEVFNRLAINPEDLEDIEAMVEEELEKARIFLNIAR